MKTVITALVAVIHVSVSFRGTKTWMATPFFERLCPATTEREATGLLCFARN